MDTDRRHSFLRLEVIPTRPPYEAALLPVSAFPMPQPECEAARRCLRSLTAVAVTQRSLAVEVFIHMAGLQHKDGSAIRFSSEGKNWLPKLGLGVWPDRPAPSIWSKEELDNLVPGQKPRTLRNHVFQITRSPKAREDARDSMLGWGSVIQVLTSDGGEIFLERSRQVLLPPISDPCFNCFPFYVPLLERASLTNSDPENLHSWFCGASIYIRESREDNAILIVSQESLRPLFRAIEAKPEGSAETVWQVPI